jgi:hypothetical protein
MNLASGSLLTVLVLYLVLHGGWYSDTAGCILQGDVRTKVKTPGTGEIMVEEAVQTSTWRGCASSIIHSPGSCLVPTRKDATSVGISNENVLREGRSRHFP